MSDDLRTIVAQMVSGAPFPSQRSQNKAIDILDAIEAAGFHILSDADLQARDDAVLERAKIRTGDVVFHVPSREEWVVAWADYQSGYMAPCGWPESQAKIADCILTRRATDEESEKLISDVEKSGRRDSHKPAAIRAMQGGKPS